MCTGRPVSVDRTRRYVKFFCDVRRTRGVCVDAIGKILEVFGGLELLSGLSGAVDVSGLLREIQSLEKIPERESATGKKKRCT